MISTIVKIATKPSIQQDNQLSIDNVQPSKVILYNDNIHTFDEVINQIIKAIKCGRTEAESKTLEVHTRGKAAIYEGTLEECLKVTSVLEEIALHTQIEY
jgi:ATP-dependent Clp protease adapter protein ClpS